MKKMLSLAAMFAVLAYASPASAELKLSGNASVRMRDTSYFGDSHTRIYNSGDDDISWQYRIRLNAAADLGNGYFFKAMVTNEDKNSAGGWVPVGYGNTEVYNLAISNFYFGRMQENCHWMVGRLPLNSFNNPIFDLTLYPVQPLETPVANIDFDRAYGANYGTKIGNGMMNATLVVLDNRSHGNTSASGDGIFNDGYALHLDYKVNVGNVTLEPQFLTTLTNTDVLAQYPYSGSAVSVPVAASVTPYTFGALVGVPAGKANLTFGGFYTSCDDYTDNSSHKVNYNGYLFRVKAEIGNFMAWYDYNHTTIKDIVPNDIKFTNHFVRVQYKVPVYSSAAGTITLQPTLRYLANKGKYDGSTSLDQQRLRSELWATVTF